MRNARFTLCCRRTLVGQRDAVNRCCAWRSVGGTRQRANLRGCGDAASARLIEGLRAQAQTGVTHLTGQPPPSAKNRVPVAKIGRVGIACGTAAEVLRRGCANGSLSYVWANLSRQDSAADRNPRPALAAAIGFADRVKTDAPGRAVDQNRHLSSPQAPVRPSCPVLRKD